MGGQSIRARGRSRHGQERPGLQRRKHRLPDRGDRAKSARLGRLQHARRRLRQAWKLREGGRRLLARDRTRSAFLRGLHEPRPRLSAEKKDDLALQDFNQAIAVNPNDAAPYLGRGNLYRSQGNFDGALADLNQAIRLNPEGPQAYHARGLIYQRQGNDVQAITDFNNAIDRDPFAGEPYEARGESLMRTGKYEKAIEDFNAALNVNANNSDGLGRPGLLLRQTEQSRQGGRVLLARDSG